MFDRVEITIKSGDGGDGAVSFRREKFVPFGGPDGGDGGNGGNVIIRASKDVDSLVEYRYKRAYKAGSGAKGQGSRKHGKSGGDLELLVPVGTVVSDLDQMDDYSYVLADLNKDGDEVTAALGGKGGGGNIHFASSTNQAPKIAQKGERGEERNIFLELKLIADVGIIGYPNAGKSSLMSKASAAKPKIANYPFTTLSPVLGVAVIGMESFIIAEVPGLIEDAHIGKGLGHDFLRHAVRTKVLIHLIDGTSPDAFEDYKRVNKELNLFDSSFLDKPQLVAINKIDLEAAKERKEDIIRSFALEGIKVSFISALTGEGVSELVQEAYEKLKSIKKKEIEPKEGKIKVFRPKPKDSGMSIAKEGEVFVIRYPSLERIAASVNPGDYEAVRQFRDHVYRAVGSRELEKAGIKAGDKVIISELEMEW